ncbi:helix-turn-helix domain-containing protein [Corynebacterium vitaeruminis]|uniref:helix-turn-helix domain-containing protein n=1 Tax=Corynebacterium vitaeruminis TaxID=38305 RepID=UPI0009DFA693|nr:helix-turn-helix domain-containing protein [Corynebacterium vitaeruminis]
MSNSSPTTTARWITVAAASKRVGLSEKTIRRLVADGTVQASKPRPRALRISVESLDGYMAAHATNQWSVAPRRTRRASA